MVTFYFGEPYEKRKDLEYKAKENEYKHEKRKDLEYKAKENEQQKNYKREKRKDPEFLEKERERDEIRKKNIKIQKQLNSMFNLEDHDDDCFKKDYLEANNHCDLNRM